MPIVLVEQIGVARLQLVHFALAALLFRRHHLDLSRASVQVQKISKIFKLLRQQLLTGVLQLLFLFKYLLCDENCFIMVFVPDQRRGALVQHGVVKREADAVLRQEIATRLPCTCTGYLDIALGSHIVQRFVLKRTRRHAHIRCAQRIAACNRRDA